MQIKIYIKTRLRRKVCNMDFRLTLILIYFNTVKDSYSYSELISIIGITYSQLDEMLKELLNKEFLKYNEYKIISLNELGIKQLIEYGFDDTDIFAIYDDVIDKNSWFTFEKIGVNDIYIPRKFNEKFK